MKGLFITFEGTEGSGKTTQISLLAERLRSMGCGVRTLREPGGTPIGEEIRHTLKHSPANHAMTPEAELLLMNASRAQLVREVIRPALTSGKIVLCDRFYDSTMAYQGYGQGLGREVVETIHRVVLGAFKPDLTLILDLPVEAGLGRAEARGTVNRYERMDSAFHQRLRQGFQDIAKREPDRCLVIDATQPADTVAEAVAEAVRSRLSVTV